MLSKIAYSLALFFLFPVFLLAQDQKDHIFSDDFAKSPLNEQSDSFFENSKQRKEKKSPIIDKSPNISDVDRNFKVAKGRNMTVKSVGIALNCLNDKHYLKHINEFRALVLKHDFNIGNVMCQGRMGLGFYDEGKEYLTLALMGADLELYRSLPAPYNKLEYSPTWFVETSQGEIWLEGTGKSLDSYFNDDGYFIFNKSQTTVIQSQHKPFFSGGKNLFE